MASRTRTVSSWLQAAQVSNNFSSFYYLVSSLGREAKSLVGRLLQLIVRDISLSDRVVLAIDDTYTERYAPKVQRASVCRNPTPGPSGQRFVFEHCWCVLALTLRNALGQVICFPLCSRMYVRRDRVESLAHRQAPPFRTKLELAAELLDATAGFLRERGKTVWVVADGFYAKHRFFEACKKHSVVAVTRLRKDAQLWTEPPKPVGQRRGRPRLYGTGRVVVAKRAAYPGGWIDVPSPCTGQPSPNVARPSWPPTKSARGTIRVLIVKQQDA